MYVRHRGFDITMACVCLHLLDGRARLNSQGAACVPKRVRTNVLIDPGSHGGIPYNAVDRPGRQPVHIAVIAKGAPEWTRGDTVVTPQRIYFSDDLIGNLDVLIGGALCIGQGDEPLAARRAA